MGLVKDCRDPPRKEPGMPVKEKSSLPGFVSKQKIIVVLVNDVEHTHLLTLCPTHN